MTGRKLGFLLVGLLAACEAGVVTNSYVEEAEPGLEGKARRATFAGPDGPVELAYLPVDGQAVVEGDMIFALTQTRAATVKSSTSLWPDGVVPFEIAPGFPNESRVRAAIEEWESKTAIRLVPRTNQRDYVVFQFGNGCSSAVGRVGGRQVITLGNGCQKGQAIHEIGHAVGLWHEQSRNDRDDFIEIRFQNVNPAMRHNFEKYRQGRGQDVGGYNFASIMHYDGFAFSANGQPTIVAKQAGVRLGQRKELSPGDIAAIAQLYGTGETPPPDECMGLDFEGRCSGTLAEWCEDGKLKQRECAADGKICGPTANFGFFCIDPPQTDRCEELGEVGRCDAGDAEWCQDGELVRQECGDRSCGFTSDRVFECLPRACGSLDYIGRCNGNVAEWCDDGRILRRDCSRFGQTCGETSEDGFYCQ